jgi:phosphatidylglycerophosphatase A
MGLHKFIATFFGIGYIGKGAGTIAAFVVCLLLYYGVQFNVHTPSRLLLLSFVLMAVGVIVSTQVEKIWGKDSNKVVIDEALGMAVSMLFLPLNFKTLLAGFILFRFFDIYKPLYIRRAEALPGGWGVMTDDLLAGIYTNIILQLSVFFFSVCGSF